MVFDKIELSRLPKNMAAIDYSGFSESMTESEYIETGKRVIGKMQFPGLYSELIREKRDFVFFTKSPEYAVRLSFPKK